MHSSFWRAGDESITPLFWWYMDGSATYEQRKIPFLVDQCLYPSAQHRDQYRLMGTSYKLLTLRMTCYCIFWHLLLTTMSHRFMSSFLPACLPASKYLCSDQAAHLPAHGQFGLNKCWRAFLYQLEQKDYTPTKKSILVPLMSTHELCFEYSWSKTK